MDNAQDLIDRLCVAAGMVMEDTIDFAVIRTKTKSQSERIRQIETAGADIAVLAAAARVVSRRWKNRT